jgi:colanic acid biosynthesis glycosyl transferase WcaI
MDSPLRLMILSIRYAPELTSNAVVITGLARALAARGHQVTVLAGTPHYQLPHVPPGFLWRLFRRERDNGVEILRCWAFPKSDGKVSKFLNYLTFTKTGFIASLFAGRPDVVLVVSPPFWLAIIALFLRTLRRCRVIYNAQDLFPEAYLASGEVRAGWLTRSMSSLMTSIYRRCDRITVITRSFADAIGTQGADPGKILTIPNFLEPSAVVPRPRHNAFSHQHGLDGKFVVMYAGNVGYTHGTELLLEAAEKLGGVEDLMFLVIGGGSKQSELARQARKQGCANFMFLPTQPGEVLSDMLASADVLVLTTKPGVGRTSFPGRIYSFLLAARPVIVSIDAESDTARLVREAGAGLVTKPGDAEEFTQALLTLYHDPVARERLARSGAEFMARQYSPQAVVEQYDGLLRRLAAC